MFWTHRLHRDIGEIICTCLSDGKETLKKVNKNQTHRFLRKKLRELEFYGTDETFRFQTVGTFWSQLSEIWTFGFQTIGTKSPNDWNPNVRIPNSIALVPNVRNPNKTIPNSWSFGFQHCLKSERSVFGRWLYTNNFKIRILRKSGDLQISSWSLIKINYYILLVGTENFFKNPYPLPPPFL